MSKAASFNWTQARAAIMARAHIRLAKPEDAEGIAMIAVDLDCAIWHAASVYYGTKCHCAVCAPKEKFQ